ncbi:hypothetical protein OG381_01665 [Streptomyces sp. NBC_00490]|uniref:hypothetical protein n=1 Tax=Streptomyces sp. NBC_00490 TaxID=2903657 RepID=UPI002E190440
MARVVIACCVCMWAEAVIRQTEPTRAIRAKVEIDSRNEDRSPDEGEMAATLRARWAEEHTRVAEERGEPTPPQNQMLKLARDALEHPDKARLEEGGAFSASAPGFKGKALCAPRCCPSTAYKELLRE